MTAARFKYIIGPGDRADQPAALENGDAVVVHDVVAAGGRHLDGLSECAGFVMRNTQPNLKVGRTILDKVKHAERAVVATRQQPAKRHGHDVLLAGVFLQNVRLAPGRPRSNGVRAMTCGRRMIGPAADEFGCGEKERIVFEHRQRAFRIPRVGRRRRIDIAADYLPRGSDGQPRCSGESESTRSDCAARIRTSSISSSRRLINSFCNAVARQ